MGMCALAEDALVETKTCQFVVSSSFFFPECKCVCGNWDQKEQVALRTAMVRPVGRGSNKQAPLYDIGESSRL